jgi:hypothetical protein
LRVYCRKRPDVDQLLMREVGVLPAHGEIGNGRGDNITSTNDIRGTNPTYTLRRLTDLPVFVSWRCERQPRNHWTFPRCGGSTYRKSYFSGKSSSQISAVPVSFWLGPQQPSRQCSVVSKRGGEAISLAPSRGRRVRR